MVASKIKNAKRQYYREELEELCYSKLKHWFKSVKAVMGKEDVGRVLTTQDSTLPYSLSAILWLNISPQFGDK